MVMKRTNLVPPVPVKNRRQARADDRQGAPNPAKGADVEPVEDIEVAYASPARRPTARHLDASARLPRADRDESVTPVFSWTWASACGAANSVLTKGDTGSATSYFTLQDRKAGRTLRPPSLNSAKAAGTARSAGRQDRHDPHSPHPARLMTGVAGQAATCSPDRNRREGRKRNRTIARPAQTTTATGRKTRPAGGGTKVKDSAAGA